MLGLASGFFGVNAYLARVRVRQFAGRIAGERAHLAELTSVDHGPSLVDELLLRSGKQSVRDSETMYDRYRELSAELSARIGVLRSQETKTKEADQRVPRLLERLGETFEKVGEKINGEDDVKDAAHARVIARYHAYREAKRAVDECQAAVQRRQREIRETQDALAENGKALEQTESDLRRVMREAGFDDERTHATTAAALRAFRGRLQRQRELRARVELLDDRAKALETNRAAETTAAQQAEVALGAVLSAAGVASGEQCIMAAQAREYREVWEKRAALEDQLAVVLREQDLRELRDAVHADGELPPPPKRNAAQIKSDLDNTAAEIDDKMKEEHALHITMTQRGASARSLNEIEEDLAAATLQAQELALELEATSYAMAQIQEIARDKHARIAPKLASRASHYFERITSGAYSEVLISRDLTISVRIPQTNRMNEAPEKSLSRVRSTSCTLRCGSRSCSR